MRVLITNEKLGFAKGAIIEDAEEYSDCFGGYVGHCNGVRVVVSSEDGAIIVEDDDDDAESCAVLV